MEKGVERVEAFKAAPQNFVVGQTLFRPPFQHAIDPDGFGLLKFIVVQIGIMNHFADFPEGFVADRKLFGKGLKGAVLAHVRKLRIEHVERDCFRIRWDFGRENKTRFRVDELPDKPRRAGAIDLWPRAG
jgi:hypothetical protein